MMRALLLAVCCAAAAAPAPALAAAPWRVLPARGDRPPPRDPTLLRLSDAVATALAQVVGAEVTIADRALADEACPGDGGECPRDVALLVPAEHVVSLVLRADQSAVDVRVYAPKVGMTRALALPCRWVEGLMSCEMDALSALAPTAPTAAATPAASTPPRPARGARATPDTSPSPEAEDAVARAFAAAAPRLARCRARGWGDTAARPEAVSVRFRVAADGALRDVRLDPAGLSDAPAFGCMARVVESIHVPAGAAPEGARSHALPLP